MDKVNQSIWDKKDRRSMRAMCLSYAKDLVVARAVPKQKMIDIAKAMFDWVWE